MGLRICIYYLFGKLYYRTICKKEREGGRERGSERGRERGRGREREGGRGRERGGETKKKDKNP